MSFAQSVTRIEVVAEELWITEVAKSPIKNDEIGSLIVVSIASEKSAPINLNPVPINLILKIKK